MELTEIKIENMIYEIRGKQVMLDSDLANLYNAETKRINEAVKRNQDKFPERFTWQLENSELHILWSQNATANINIQFNRIVTTNKVVNQIHPLCG